MKCIEVFQKKKVSHCFPIILIKLSPFLLCFINNLVKSNVCAIITSSPPIHLLIHSWFLLSLFNLLPRLSKPSFDQIFISPYFTDLSVAWLLTTFSFKIFPSLQHYYFILFSNALVTPFEEITDPIMLSFRVFLSFLDSVCSP